MKKNFIITLQMEYRTALIEFIATHYIVMDRGREHRGGRMDATGEEEKGKNRKDVSNKS